MRPRAHLVFASLGLGASLCLSACGDDEAARAEAVSAEADARAIAEIVATDPAGSVLDDVGDAIDTDRPVLAADLLDQLGLPSMRRQVTRLEDLAVSTGDGRSLRARAVRLYRARVDGYVRYHALLVRGSMAEEGEALLDALDAVSDNERDLLALQRELAVLAPIARAPEAPDEEESLGGLPPVEREAPLPDDETPGAEPDGREEDPAALEDALPEM